MVSPENLREKRENNIKQTPFLGWRPSYFQQKKWYLAGAGIQVGSGRVGPGRGFQKTVTSGDPRFARGISDSC